MPTSAFKQAMRGSPIALGYPPSYQPDGVIIWIASENALGYMAQQPGSSVLSGRDRPRVSGGV